MPTKNPRVMITVTPAELAQIWGLPGSSLSERVLLVLREHWRKDAEKNKSGADRSLGADEADSIFAD